MRARYRSSIWSPGGRLPVSFPRDMSDLLPWDVSALEVPHDLLHGYRWLDHQGSSAEFPFGFGLGYTSFAVSDLRVERRDDRFVCQASVRNTGARRGATVVQLYVSCRDSALFRVEKELKGFGRVEMDPNQEVDLEIELRDEDLRFYDADAAGWELESCLYDFRVGQSSADLPLSSRWRLEGADWVAK